MTTREAGWYGDPTARHQVRYWDGTSWSEHVGDDGVQGVDPIDSLDRIDGALTLDHAADPDKIRRQVSDSGIGGAGIASTAPGGGTIFTEPVLVVNQKAKLIELTNQYGVFDAGGKQIGSVNEVGQTTVKKALRLLTSVDQFMTHRLEVSDNAGRVLLQLTRPAKVMKSRVLVSDGSGMQIGEIAQENMIGKINFGMYAGGAKVGAIKAENWRAWNFRIEDATGNEVARITKTWEGLAKTMFTTADNYVVQIHTDLADPLRSLVVASALTVDTALKQDDRGLG